MRCLHHFKTLLLCYLLPGGVVQPLYSQSEADLASDVAAEMYEKGEYEKTIAFCNNTLKNQRIRDSADSIEAGMLHYYRGMAFYYLDDYIKSIDAYQKGIALSPGNQEGIEQKGVLYNEKSFSEYRLHRYISSYKSMEESVKWLDKLMKPNLDYLLSGLLSLADNYANYGYFEQALSYLRRAQSIYEENQSEIDRARGRESASYDIYLRYIKANIYKEKIDQGFLNADRIQLYNVLREMESLFRYRKPGFNQRERLMLATTFNMYGDHFLTRTEKVSPVAADSAIYYLDTGLALLENINYTDYENSLRFNKCKAYEHKKDFKKAIEIIEDLLVKQDKNSLNYSFFLTQKGLVLLKKGDYQEALHILRQAIAFIHDAGTKLKPDYSNFVPSEALNEAGLLLDISKRISVANISSPIIKQFLHTINKLAFIQFKNCYTQNELNSKLQEYFYASIYGVLKGEPRINLEQTINDIEDIHSYLAWQKFNQSRTIVDLPLIDSVEQVELGLRNKLADAIKSDATHESDSLKNEIKKHCQEVKSRFPMYAQFKHEHYNVRAFQRQLIDDEAVLKYMFFGDSFVVFIITVDTLMYRIQPWGKKEEALLTSHLSQIKNPSVPVVPSQDLTYLLIPLKAINYKQLTIIPDVPIYQLPFGTLSYQDKYLIELKNIGYSSHLRFVHLNNTTPEKKEVKVTIFAPDYPLENSPGNTRNLPYYLNGAKQESEAIEKLFSSQSFIGVSATKKQFLNKKTNSTILHMAMHAKIDPSHPELSHFIFPDQEKLYVEEIYAIKKPNNLTVLSACNTGAGIAEAGSEIVTLNRAMTFAGAKATVASLWEVPDRTTKDLMIDFYRYLKAGKPKSLALQLAKSDYLGSDKNVVLKHPYYWAGFVLYGDSEPITQKSIDLWKYALLGIIIVLLLFLYKKFLPRKG